MPLEKLTPKTLVNRPRLVKAIVDAAERGYEVVEDQLSLGYGAVGIPLVTPRGQKFALTVSFTTSAYTYPKIVKELLLALSATTGHSPSPNDRRTILMQSSERGLGQEVRR